MFHASSNLSKAENAISESTITHLVVGDGHLYGFDILSGSICRIGSDAIEWLETVLPTEPFLRDGAPRVILRCFMQNDIFYALVDESERVPSSPYPQYALLIIPLSGNDYKIIRGEGIRDICSYRENTLLLLGSILKENRWNFALFELNLKTDVLVELPIEMPGMDTKIAGLAYDPARDTIYYANSGAVMASAAQNPFSPVAPLTAQDLSTEAPGWVLDSGQYAIFSFGIYIIDFSAGLNPQKTLIIAAPSKQAKLWDAFSSGHPNVSVLLNAEDLSTAQIAQRIRNGDTQTDIFQIMVNSSFRDFLDKGYAASLSDSTALSEDMDRLYPALRSALTDVNGRPMAYPVQMLINLWQVDLTLWESYFGKEPVPSTFSSFFSTMLRFEEEHGTQGDAYFVQDFDYTQMVELVLSTYIQSYSSEDQPLVFSLPVLQETMEILAQIQELRLSRNQGSANEGAMHLTDQELTPCLFTPFGGGNLLMSSGNSQANPWQTLLPFTFEDGSSPVIRAYLSVMVVNPNSKRQVLARQFLEGALSMELNPVLFYSIHPEADQPLPKPGAQERVQALKERREILKKAIAEGDMSQNPPAELPDMKEELINVEQLLADQSIILWLIPPEGLEDYRRVAPFIRFFETSTYTILDEGPAQDEFQKLIRRYCQGMLPLSDFLGKLETMMRMMLEEG